MKVDLKHAYRAGVANVFLLNGYERIDAPDGAAYRYVDSVQLDERICAAVIQKPGRLNASEIVYLRLRADWRQEDLAQRLHVSAQTISLWERGQVRLQAAADLLLRLRFLTEAPKRRRPKLKVRNLCQYFDSLVRIVCDFNFIGYWDNGWTFTHEQRAASFVSRQETLMGSLPELDISNLRVEATHIHPVERDLIVTGYARERVRGKSWLAEPKATRLVSLSIGNRTTFNIGREHVPPIEIEESPRHVIGRFARKATSDSKVEKIH